MAAVTATLQDGVLFSTPVGPKKTSAGALSETCYVTATFAGTYATGSGKATITAAAIATRIQTEKRDGKTVTVYSVAPVQPGDEAGAGIFAAYPTLSAGTYTMELLQADNSTTRADGAMGVWNHGVCFAVGYTAV